MAIITFTSDFGQRDAYVAIVKAALLNGRQHPVVVDISHHIAPANVAQAAFVLGSAFGEFPAATIHLVAIDSQAGMQQPVIAAEVEGHFFITPDNGLISLISEWEPEKVVLLPAAGKGFVARDVMAPAALNLANGALLEELGDPAPDIKAYARRKVKANRQEIMGHVMHVDHYGNLITNIPRHDFDILSKDKTYTIKFGRESARHITRSLSEVEPGDCYVTFNHLDLLEIGIRHGRAQQLLGLDFDSPVIIKFEDYAD